MFVEIGKFHRFTVTISVSSDPYKPRTGHTGCTGHYEPCTGHTGHTGLNIQHTPGVSCMDYCCPSSWLLSTGNPVLLYRVRSLSSSTADAYLLWQPMGTVLFTNILDSLMAPCLVYNTAMYTVYGQCGHYNRCMVHTLASVADAAGAWFIRIP